MEVQSPIITIYRGETSKELDVITGAFDKEKVNYYKRINPSGHPGSRRYRIWDNREYFPFEIKILQKDETYVRQIIADRVCQIFCVNPVQPFARPSLSP